MDELTSSKWHLTENLDRSTIGAPREEAPPAETHEEAITAHHFYPATLTRCEGSWLEQAADEDEQQRIDSALKQVRQQRKLAIEFYQNPQAANIFSLELFRGNDFRALHLSDRLIVQVLAAFGEPPVVTDESDPALADYLRQAVQSIATARVRSALAGQLRRYMPYYVEVEHWKEAIAIDNNAFRTSLGKEVSPFLAQMTLAGLARWYEENETPPDQFV